MTKTTSLDFAECNSLVAYFATGSRVIPGCHVTECTDYDYVLLPYYPDKDRLNAQLEELGYVKSVGNDYKNLISNLSDFTAWRHPDNLNNLIVCNNINSYMQWKTATKYTIEHKITDKTHRIQLFTLVRSMGTTYMSIGEVNKQRADLATKGS